MKKITFLALLITASTSSAQEIEQMKEASMQACNAQVAKLSAEQQEAGLKVCECTVENTDFEALQADTQTGNIQKVIADSQAIAQDCAKKHGVK